MTIQEHVSLKGKTTMRIGGTAKYYAEVATKEDVEQAYQAATKLDVPLIILAGGSNTIFADGDINALIVRPVNKDISIDGQTVTVGAAAMLPNLINELMPKGLDLSPLTGILGTVGGAVFGNSGQGPKGIWLDTFLAKVEVWHNGAWHTFDKNQCEFDYRDSVFKHMKPAPFIWSVTLRVPEAEPEWIAGQIEKLLEHRIKTQPHVKTAGSCFKAVNGIPAWQLIDEAGLRNTTHGDIHISTKHANFLINDGNGTFEDASAVVQTVMNGIPEPLAVEMRFIQPDGTPRF